MHQFANSTLLLIFVAVFSATTLGLALMRKCPPSLALVNAGVVGAYSLLLWLA